MQPDALRVGTFAREQRGGVRMPERPFAGREARVQRSRDQRVRERQPGPVLEQPCRAQAVGGAGRGVEVEPCKPGGVAQRRAGPEDRDRARERARSLGQARELAFDDAPDLLGAERPEPRGGLVVRGGAVGDELREQGPEQKRVAAGDGMARVGEPGARLRQALAHQCLRRDRTERARPDGRLGCTGQEFLQQLGCRGRLA